MSLAFGVLRVLQDLGFVLYAGTLIFWALVWPRGQQHARLVRLVTVGAVMLIITTLSRTAVSMLGGGSAQDQITGSSGTIMIIGLAALAGSVFFLPDIARRAVTGWRRGVVVGWVAVVAVSLCLQSAAVGGRWAVIETISTTAHVLATAAWLGGLVALLVMLSPGARTDEVGPLVPAFARVRLISVIVLIATGIVQVVTTAGLSALVTGYGVVLLIKAVLFAALIVGAAYGRTWVARVTFRSVYVGAMTTRGADAGYPADDTGRDDDPTLDGPGPGGRALAAVLRAELALALVIVAVSSALVGLTPVG